MISLVVAALCGATAAGPSVAAMNQYLVVPERSIVAFITFRGGLLSGLTENLITNPETFELGLSVGSEPTQSQFYFHFDTDSLQVNDPRTLLRWYRPIHERQILDKPPDEMRDSKRRRIRKTILSDKLLDAERFPTIHATTTSIVPVEPARPAETHRIRLDVTIHDRTVAVDWPAIIIQKDDGIEVELTGGLKFSDFGIDPYSTFLGTVKYKDEFRVFAHIEAQPAASGVASRH